MPSAPTSRPSSEPSAPSVPPSLLPTIRTRQPSTFAPSVKSASPSVILSVAPTVVATSVPTKATVHRPTARPSLIMDTVTVSRGGNYSLVNVETHYVVNVTAGTTVMFVNERVFDKMRNFSVMYTVIPQSHVYIYIEYFSNRSDLIDLTAFETVHSLGDLNITRGSAIIHLGANQTIKIQNLFPDELKESTLCGGKALLALIVSVFGLVICVPLAAPLWRYLYRQHSYRVTKKVNKTHFLFKEEDNISDSSLAVSEDTNESEGSESDSVNDDTVDDVSDTSTVPSVVNDDGENDDCKSQDSSDIYSVSSFESSSFTVDAYSDESESDEDA
eukprot:gene24618-30986_t